MCGPASVNSVRDGNIFFPHDTKFIFAEVNADRIVWMMKPGGDMVAVDDNPRCVGSFISTKAVGSNGREDVTANYKYPEGRRHSGWGWKGEIGTAMICLSVCLSVCMPMPVCLFISHLR